MRESEQKSERERGRENESERESERVAEKDFINARRFPRGSCPRERTVERTSV